MKYFLLLITLIVALPAHAEDDFELPTARLVEKKTDIGTLSYPILMNLENFDAQEEINIDTLAQMNDWHCHLNDSEKPPEGMSFNAKSKITLFNDVAFSYITEFDYYCGGVTRDRNIGVNNYYLHTGKQIFIEEMFPITMPAAERNAFIMKDHTFKKPECRGAYDDSDLMWHFYLTPKAVIFRPHFGDASQTCVEDFPVSGERMEKYLLPGTLSRPALYQDEYRE